MAVLKYELTATVNEFNDFADRLGYQTEVPKSVEELALLVEPISVQDRVKPNPETRQVFLERIIKETLDSKFYAPFVTQIEGEVRNERDAEIEATKQTIRDRSTISFT